jgi:DNA-binding transcriptional MerR regulator
MTIYRGIKMKDKMTLDDLAEELNKLTSLEGYNDKRVSETIKPRRIRDYIGKKIIPEGIRDGKYKYYNEEHLNTLIRVRQMQSEGLADNDIKDLLDLEKEDEKLSVECMNTLDQFTKNTNNSDLNNLLGSIKSRSEVITKTHNTNLLSSDSLSLKSSLYLNKKIRNDDSINIPSKTWKEYEIEEGFILKIEKNAKQQDIESLLKKIKNTIKKNSGENNDKN